jgi:hypothetical protein
MPAPVSRGGGRRLDFPSLLSTRRERAWSHRSQRLDSETEGLLMYQSNDGRDRRASTSDRGLGKQPAMVTSTVILSREHIEILRRIAGVRTACATSISGKTSHSVSSVLRQVLDEVRPLLEGELAEAGFQ